MTIVQAIDEQSQHLETVKQLWRLHSATLGFLPEGGFQDYARERHVVIALDGSGVCVGYLLYRIVREKATIAHFCVATEVRRQGYARLLLNWLIQETKNQRGILLSCRTDFEASKTWPRLGFYPIGKKQGRAGELTIWWQGHGHRDLFTSTDQPGAIEAVVDANVFIDLVDQNNDETLGLQADWLQPFITICCTPELLIDINRNQDANTQKRRRLQADQFKMLECSAEAFHKAEKQLLPLFTLPMSEQDESDFRHVVRALACDADVFVTRDEALLNRADEVFDLCGLSIVRPGELATQVDTLQQEHLYQRNQVAGTNQIFQTRITTIDDKLVSAIKTNDEKKFEVSQPLNRYLAAPQQYHCHRLNDKDGSVLAVYVVDRQHEVDVVPMFRVCDTRRTATLTRALLTGIVRDAARAQQRAVVIADKLIDVTACADLGFLSVQEGQLKLLISGWLAVSEVTDRLTWNDPQVDKIKAALPTAHIDAVVASDVEHCLWPVKLSDSAIPSYIVAIQPRFAEHLFDGRLAQGTLFGADVDLALNPESAYYRAARPSVITSPARVLWYVSQDERYRETMSIRACSRIVEMLKGTPKALFKRFRRLGVYEWADVLETAGGIDNEMMAFRFDDTELLRPMNWDEVQSILRSHGIHTSFQSPVAIPAEVFGQLYAASLNPPSVR